MSKRSSRARLENRTRRTPSSFRRGPTRARLLLYCRKIHLAAVTAVDPFLPGLAQEAELLGLSPFQTLHQAQRFANDLARRRVATARDLGLDEIRQLIRERHVHIHDGLP